MADKCTHHPGRDAVVELDGLGYCQKCKEGQETAAKAVDEHARPKSCFIWYKNAQDGWQPITGTGCAHWVAHNKGIQLNSNPKSRDDVCLAGYTQRVKVLHKFLQDSGNPVALDKVVVGDIWISQNEGHTGIVSAIGKNSTSGATEIFIMHASSDQHTVATNQYPNHWNNLKRMLPGTFYRYGMNLDPKRDP